ncbi:MAG: TonB-dependent receptor [Burkholderiaceae bacterium]|nr:TonB-dependent receptor [Burkholderiaceae bacterium]
MSFIASPRLIALAAAAAALQAGAAFAQQAAPAPAAAASASDGLKLDRIVITGTSTARTAMQQSVSVSSLDGDEIARGGATSAAEVLRAIPGLRSESSGGEGNANITARGVPISAGGSRYVSMHEDGLPVLLIGDAAFATPDMFTRTDYMTDSLDAIRGGSAGTMGTNSPAAIVNFLSKTGKASGGAVGLTMGLDHRSTRLDFALGGSLGSDLTYQIGGYNRVGEGTRNTDINVENGGQFRANLTKKLKGGYVRASFKHLSDSTPTYLPVPVALNGNRIEQIPGIDPRSAFFINSNFPSDITRDASGNLVDARPADGLTVKSTSFGLEAQMTFDGDLTVTNRFRRSENSGRFLGVFPAGGNSVAVDNGYTGSTPVFVAHTFNTSLDDFGNTLNDLRLQKGINLGSDQKLTVTGGLFTGRQSDGATWRFNRYNMELTGDGARLLDNNGNPTTAPAGENIWGGCCYFTYHYDVNVTAPYAAATWDMGALTVDASLRRDSFRTTGTRNEGTSAGWDPAQRTVVSNKRDVSSHSLGVNYRLSKDLAVFGRTSTGASLQAPDRGIGLLGKTDQVEVGVKSRMGALSSFITLFSAKTREDAGFEATTQTYRGNNFDAKGVEAELSWRAGAFSVSGGGTLTDASIASGANQGNTPRRQAKLVYQLTPSYQFAMGEVGATIIGTTKAYAQDDNQVVLPGYTVVNLFAAYELADSLTLSLSVNNLFNTVGYTEAEGQNALYVARSINGRSAKATLKYSF